MFSPRFQNAVRILRELERECRSSAVLSESQHISISNIEQIVAELKKLGIVRGVRGPGGGYELVGNLRSVTIEDLSRALNTGRRRDRLAEVAPSSWRRMNLAEYFAQLYEDQRASGTASGTAYSGVPPQHYYAASSGLND